MFEIFVGFFCGYIVGKTVGTLSSLPGKPDKILSWDSQSLGYRPITHKEKAEPGKSYLICYEVRSGNQER